MEERDFWKRMEYRLCAEFRGAAEPRLRYMWCDGFLPQGYDFEHSPPVIQGHVWMVLGQQQELWTFSLLLPVTAQSPGDIDWGKLMPSGDLTHWVTLDQPKRHLMLDPLGASADPA